MRAVLYARVSGDDRHNATSSLEAQLDQCREYAQAHNWEVIGELVEDSRGASGADLDLPQLNEALRLASEKRFDMLVVRELDRLARNLAKQLVIEKEFERFGVNIDYVIEDYQNTPEGKLSKHVRAVIAEYEREKIRERMVRGRRNKAKKGFVVLHGNTLYGYKAIEGEMGNQLVVDEPTARIVRMIFDWYVIEKWGTPTITKKLNQLGIPAPSAAKNTKTPKAVAWNHAQIRRILKNEAYAGNWRYGKRNRSGKNPTEYQIVVKVPAIIDTETFQQAQIQRKRNTNRSGSKPKHNYLFGRRCICGECNSPMTSLTGSKYSYYRCPVHYLQGTHYMTKKCTTTTHFSVNYWDETLWQEIRSFLANPEKLSRGIALYQQEQEKTNAPIQDRIRLLDELLQQNRQKLSRLVDLYLSGEFEKSILIDRKQSLENTIKALEDESKDLKLKMSQSLTKEQLTELQAFSEHIAEGLCEADEDFKTRRKLIEYLRAKVHFSVEDGQQVALLFCEFGFSTELTRSNQASSHQLGSARPTNSREEGEDNYMLDCERNTDYRHS